MRVLGIDPGTRITGYGCIEPPAILGGRPGLIEAGVVRLTAGPATPPLASRLRELERDLTEIIGRLRPDAVCVESLFSNPKHPGTVITMAHARGVILLAASRAVGEVIEVPPAEVKRAITGSGRATKPQIQASVQRVLALPDLPSPPDVADALAIAICVGQRRSLTAYDPAR